MAERLDDGLVIYDETTKQAHALNGSAARLWSLADGRRTLSELAEMAELDEPGTATAVEELAAAGLLVAPGVSRRAVLRRAAVVGAGAVAAAPIIDTVLIPTAAAHASTGQTGGNGGGGGSPPAPPVANNDVYTTSQNTPLTVPAPGVLANDISPSGNPLTAILVSGPSHGTLALNSDGSFTYTPAPGVTGTDSFTYQANDGTLSSNVATVSIQVNPPVPPVANNDVYTTSQNTALTVPAPGVLANDISPSGKPLTAVLVSGPSHGTLALNSDGSFTYTPAPGFTGADSFTYQANDGTLNSNIATVGLTVT